MADLLVIGAGLIGTSVALAVAGTRDVALHDRNEAHLTQACERGAGRRWDQREKAGHCLLAVPPSAIPALLAQLQRDQVAATYSHVASVQAQVQDRLAPAGADPSSVCGTHPMAGAELPGPALALATLFQGRPWLLCPGPTTSAAALGAARELAQACGGQLTVASAVEHDRTVALVSHLPQVAASALASLLQAHPQQVALSGPGLRDTTRIAASDPVLWEDVLLLSAPHLAPLVAQLAQVLARTAQALELAATARTAAQTRSAAAALRELLEAGRAGRTLVPVKRGGTDRDFISVDLSVPDEPGQLAALLATAAAAGVNVEDVTVDHLPGRPTGVISLLVTRAQQQQLRTALGEAGWTLLSAAAPIQP